LKKLLIIFFIFSFLFGIEYTKKEKQFLKNNPVIYISAMEYWPIDKDGESIHTNYMKLLNKYGGLNLQPVYYKYWSDGFCDAKKGITFGIMALSYSKHRERWFYYTKPYNYTPYYVLVNKNSDITSIKDLKNKKVYIAKNSILRETLKNSKFNIIYTKNPYKELANGKIDAILLFYIPQTKYLDKFRIIKTFIDKNGEEYIGISKKYPELYSIINKAMKIVPYSEIEKIRAIPYETRISKLKILTPEIKLKDLITKQDVIFLVLLVLGLLLILFFFFSRKFLNLSIKKFLVSIFIFDVFILGFIVYEIVVFNYYSNKILEIKSKSFNSLYMVSEVGKSVRELNREFYRMYRHQHHADIKKLFENNYPISDNLLVNNQPLKNILTTKYFTPTELSNLAYIKKLLDELLNIQKQVLKRKINISIYNQKFYYIIDEFQTLKQIIKNENENEIYIIKKKLKYQFLLLIFSVLLFVIESVFIFIMIRKKIYKPLDYLIGMIRDYKNGKKIKKEFFYEDEVGEMIQEFISLQTQLDKKIEELNQHKNNLEQEVKKEVEKRIFQEEILLKQSRLALMGEMIDVIAHQWKQPLNTISLSTQLLKLDKNDINEKYILNFADNISIQVAHMIETLEEFRGFFRENKHPEVVCMEKVVKKVLVLLQDELMRNSIKIEMQIDEDFCIKGSFNEFEHLLITLLTNAKDIFKERNIKDKKIIIKTHAIDEFYYLEVIDNAGGIPEAIIDKIFELNFTTREKGTGVGLYLATQIAIKHNGVLEVENTENGAKFYFKVKSDN